MSLPRTDAEAPERRVVAPVGFGKLPVHLAVLDGPADVVGVVHYAGERCGPCKGYGLVRGIGRRAGQHYTTVNGAQAALVNGRAVDCPACHGLGAIVPALDLAVEDDARAADAS